MYYSDDIIEEVRTASDIVDVVSGYVRLEKKGSTYFGLCPFHNEKTPSFSVTPSKQMYYCFGCGAGGNAITFVMDYENYTFPEALKYLADRAGINLPEEEMSVEQRKEAGLKASLLDIYKLAGKYYYYQLKQEHGKRAYDYFKKRELSDETIRKFGLGYSNPYSDDLYKYIKSKNYNDEILKESGLFTISERGVNDKFWNRAMFPIMDVNNRIIAFGGRVLGDGEPKYLNSPETKIFDKSRNLYGLNYAKTSRENYMLLCEGYMDVIAMQQAGFVNAVASLGTAFTPQQANLLKRYTKQVILTYDSDGAGVKAALRAIPILKSAGLSAKVLNLKPYKDPDEFIKALGTDAFRERIENAENSFLFEIRIVSRNYDLNDPEQKTAFYQETAKKLLEFSEELERDNYTQAVSKQFNIPYESLKRLVNYYGGQALIVQNVRNGQQDAKPREKLKNSKNEGIKKSQRLLLSWLVENSMLYPAIKDIISPEDFTEGLYYKVAKEVFRQLESGNVNPAGILNDYINDDEEYRDVALVFNTSIDEAQMSREDKEKAITETVKRIKKNSLDKAGRNAKDIKELQRIIREQSKLNSLHISLEQG